jgi:hypothetical protein
MLAEKGYSWKAASARLPPSRQVWHIIRNPRVLLAVGVVSIVVLMWRSMGSAAGEMQKCVFLLRSLIGSLPERLHDLYTAIVAGQMNLDVC